MGHLQILWHENVDDTGWHTHTARRVPLDTTVTPTAELRALAERHLGRHTAGSRVIPATADGTVTYHPGGTGPGPGPTLTPPGAQLAEVILPGESTQLPPVVLAVTARRVTGWAALRYHLGRVEERVRNPLAALAGTAALLTFLAKAGVL